MKPLIILALAAPLAAQVPDAPKPQQDRTETVLLVSLAATRALDVYSTHRMLARGDHELLLPSAVANHTPAMAAYSASTVLFDWLVARKLERHHRKLARLFTALDAAQDGFWAIHNFTLPSCPRGPRE